MGSGRGLKPTPIEALACRLAGAVTAAVACAHCLSIQPLTPERAAIERAAIHQDLRQDSGTLNLIASKRAKAVHADLAGRAVSCVISEIDIQFISETHATYRATYACGVAPWRPGRSESATTSMIALDLLKDETRWMINGFL